MILIHGCALATGAQSTPLQLSPPQGTSNQTISKSITTVYSLPTGALKMQRVHTREKGSLLKWEALRKKNRSKQG